MTQLIAGDLDHDRTGFSPLDRGGLRALVAALGAHVVEAPATSAFDEVPQVHDGASLLMVWHRPPPKGHLELLRRHLARGGRAVVLAAAGAVPSLASVIVPAQGRAAVPAPAVATAVPGVIARPSAADALVFTTHLTARAADGSTLVADGWVSLAHLDGEVLATVDGVAVARSLPVGSGVLIVVGCPALVEDRWLASADGAAFLACALTGRVECVEAPRWVKSYRQAGTSPHPAVRVVQATTGHSANATQSLIAAVPPGEPVDSETFLAAVRRAGRLLPPEVHDALVDFADNPGPAGALLVRGLPVGELPPTPLSSAGEPAKERLSEFVLLTAARRLGQPVGYLPEHGGRIVQNLAPTPDAVGRQTSTSSGVELAFHTETAFHPHKPRYLLLLCLRGDPAARTTLCSVQAVMDRLRLGTLAVLREARFRTGVDESFTGGRTDRLGRLVPVLAGTRERPSFTFDADLMVGEDAEAESALDELRSAVAEAMIGVVLEAGDLLVVDNTVAVHGRSPFTARFDGTDRWLQRTFVVADLAPSAAERDGRVITTRFSDR